MVECGAASAKNVGCGVVIHEGGYILTGSELIGDAKSALITYNNGVQRNAVVVGHDQFTATCLLKSPYTYAPTATLGNSDSLEVGSFLLTIGNPYGMEFSPSTGFASHLARKISERLLIQISMPIRPGDTGAPVFNRKGELIGIVVAALSNSTFQASHTENLSYDIGFVAPINDLKNGLDQFIARGKIERGWLGVEINSLSSLAAKQMGIQGGAGIRVVKVFADTPAQKAGLKENDIILEVNGYAATNTRNMRQAILDQPNVSLKLKVWRDKQILPIVVELGLLPNKATTVIKR